MKNICAFEDQKRGGAIIRASAIIGKNTYAHIYTKYDVSMSNHVAKRIVHR